MSLLKPSGITGLNPQHPLNANIKSFVEFGVADKDLVTDTAISTTAPTIDDADLGVCRAFSDDAHNPNITVPVAVGDTVVVIKRFTGTYLNSSNTRLRYLALVGGDILIVQENGFSSDQFSVHFRSSFGTTAERTLSPYEGSSLPQGVAEVVVAPVSFGTPYSVTINGTDVQSPSVTEITETAYSAVPVNVPLLTTFNTTASANVAAIIVFNRALTAQEITDITSDPWAMTNGVQSASITLNAAPVYGATISGSYANFAGTPTGPLTASDGTRAPTVPVTVDSAASTFTGTFPDIPAAGASLPAGSLPYPGNLSVTLPDPGA